MTEEKAEIINSDDVITEELLQEEGELDIKHPLQNKWALWFFKNDRTKKWEDNLRLVTKFDSVEDFWAIYNHIQLSSKLQVGCDYSIFKDGIQPMWEDKANKNGGRWLFQLAKQQRYQDLDRMWLETILCMIGESFEGESDFVNGAVVQVRPKGDKIAVWTSDCSNRDVILKVGNKYKERLQLPQRIVLGYQSHQDSQTRTGSTARNQYSL